MPTRFLRNTWSNGRGSIVVVGDFTKDGTQAKPSLSWANSIIPPDGTSIRILRLDFRISLHGASIWRQLSEKGDELLLNLQRESAQFQVREQPHKISDNPK